MKFSILFPEFKTVLFSTSCREATDSPNRTRNVDIKPSAEFFLRLTGHCLTQWRHERTVTRPRNRILRLGKIAYKAHGYQLGPGLKSVSQQQEAHAPLTKILLHSCRVFLQYAKSSKWKKGSSGRGRSVAWRLFISSIKAEAVLTVLPHSQVAPPMRDQCSIHNLKTVLLTFYVLVKLRNCNPVVWV